MIKDALGYFGNSAIGQEVIHSIPGIVLGSVTREVLSLGKEIRYGFLMINEAGKKGVDLNDQSLSPLIAYIANHLVEVEAAKPENYLINNSPLRRNDDGKIKQIPLDEAVYNRLEVLAGRANLAAGVARGVVSVGTIGALLLAAEVGEKVRDIRSAWQAW